jgi:hypothetical protein
LGEAGTDVCFLGVGFGGCLSGLLLLLDLGLQPEHLLGLSSEGSENLSQF